jgi:hypothetical protein
MKVSQYFENMEAKQKEIARLTTELSTSLLIKMWFPNIFEEGAVKRKARGKYLNGKQRPYTSCLVDGLGNHYSLTCEQFKQLDPAWSSDNQIDSHWVMEYKL